MKTIMRFFIGIAVGIATAVSFVLAPSPEDVRTGFGGRLKQHFRRAMQAGRDASAERRKELQQELAEMMTDPPETTENDRA